MLLTKALERRFEKVGRQAGKGDQAIVVARFFAPDSSWSWYALEYDPGPRVFFGLVKGLEVELGYFGLDELEGAKGPLGLGIERDLYWEETTLGDVRASLKAYERALEVGPRCEVCGREGAEYDCDLCSLRYCGKCAARGDGGSCLCPGKGDPYHGL